MEPKGWRARLRNWFGKTRFLGLEKLQNPGKLKF